MKTMLSALTLITAAAAGSADAAPVFNFQFIPGTSAEAQQGFLAAAARWSSLLDDDVTINMTVGFNPLDPGILGQAQSARQLYSYSTVRDALAADAKSAYDATAVAHLPTGGSFGMLLNYTANNPNGMGSPVPYVDNNGNANNTNLRITTASARALGLATAPQTISGCIGSCDGFIQFSSNYTFDFNPNDGIDADAFDFVGVAAHEIGHTLGFISGVDILDYNSTAPDFYNDDEFTYVTTLDMFRHSAQSTASGVIDWTADERDKYFSLDGGATQGPLFSTGVTHGDGRQASHWKDDLFIGLMDPTAGMGELLQISQNDVMAMDVIGWDVSPIPEPSTAGMLAAGLMLLGGRKVRKSKLFRKSTK
ncbi:putative secreted protein with PEP-CTERM sorting signal [Pseudoduganella flava]|uniref:PEP-CTERM sorting domain-containing protein n=1 Tax=Pseudoduganella flava TaxID=871742 RepID=A0A562PLC1_9BURK|nr:NF038122 family metalloprotease [Pseudoduganella flava]QGZ42290.1 PEP-CTERM sorting domain-containing protein [Pseudoduganella flava]TWI44836.1 putative secreted protein with PEP-CTERM sorting signal [Pseudoduganella flava]